MIAAIGKQKISSAMQRQISLALEDLVKGVRHWRIWYVLGVSELRQRYRRSVLGPFWITLSMSIQVAIMGFLLAFLFGIPVGRYLPFLCVSIVTWTFLSTSINEGANCFIQMSTTILQIKRPLSTYVMLILWRNAIIFAHTIIIFVVAALAFQIVPSAAYLLIPVGLALLFLNVSWMALASGLLSARFRDVPMLIQNAFNVLLWLTPVYYQPDQLGSRARLIVELNPFTYVLEVARAPFLNTLPPLSTWLAAGGIALFGWLLTFALLVRTRSRVPFWL
jgi:ABC-type polysaccharide/polyol phosphate export permease